jgi:hypothetical protein
VLNKCFFLKMRCKYREKVTSGKFVWRNWGLGIAAYRVVVEGG